MQQNPPSPAPIAGESLVEYLRTQRQNAGWIFIGLSVFFLALTIFLAYKGYQGNATADKPVETKLDKDENPLEPSKPSENKSIQKVDAIVGAIVTLAAFVVVGAVGAWLLIGLPASSEEKQRTEARKQLLVVGGIVGMLMVTLGGLYFYMWNESLGNWLEKGQEAESKWSLIALVMVVMGAGLVLIAVQPARAEERNNTLIRRLVYGTNLGLTSLLLFVVLIVANVIFSYKITSKLDVTEAGFYSMSPQTEDFLKGLDQTIVVYAILRDSGGPLGDLRDVLERFQEVSADKFKVKFINPLTNSSELAMLKTDYPPVQDGQEGVLLTFQSDKKRFSFIPTDEFFTREQVSRNESRLVFVGEGRLVKELLFLADNKQKPKIYFTQSADELPLAGDREPNGISKLREFLEKNYLEVLPLTFEVETAKVPDDCSVLVIADPQKTFPANQVEAIRKYMTDPLPGGRKGKLIVLSGATQPSPTSRKVSKTGLEPLLAQFNVGLVDKYLFAMSSDRQFSPAEVPVNFLKGAEKTANSIERVFRRFSIVMFFPREVDALTTNPSFTASPLLATATEGGAWVEDELPSVRVEQMYTQANRDGRLKRFRTVGVVVSEGTIARAAVYGDGEIFTNRVAEAFGGESPLSFDLLGATIDWLRDRPPVPSGVLSKTYSVYVLPNAKTLDSGRLRYLPLWFTILGIGGLGVGVWLSRRQQA